MPVLCGRIASWNTEGINLDLPCKLYEFIEHMWDLDIAVLCLQEAHCRGTLVLGFEGFSCVFSGHDDTTRERAG
eukprot:1512736-Pyramimonas_sp.AAC.1